MARFLGPDNTLKSPRSTHSYRVESSPRWRDEAGLRPPAYIIGVGGFGVTYRVVDERGHAYAMKEYFPRDYAERGNDGRITPKASEGGVSRKIFEEGLRRFVAESHMLMSFNHENICRVVDTFDDNGTSYQVMRLIEGRETQDAGEGRAPKIQRRVTLDDYLKEIEAAGVEIDLPLIEPILRQLLDALQYIHTEGALKAQAITGESTRAVLHRDIKPGNILIEAPGGSEEATAADILRTPGVKALLIDFGSARIFREVEDDDVSRSIGVVTEGYAPGELKDNNPELQGPYSDIFSLAAVIWRAFVGKKPSATSLANGARLVDLAKPIPVPGGEPRPRAPKAFLEAVDRALSAGTKARPQTVAEWRAQLWPANVPPPPPPPGERKQPKQPDKRWLYAGAGAAALSVAGFLFWNVVGSTERHIMDQARQAYEDASAAYDEASSAADQAKADAERGKAEVDPATSSAAEATEKYARYEAAMTPLRIFHSGTSGSTEYGDKYVHVVIGDEVDANVWCHRKGSNVEPLKPYSTYKYPNIAVNGQDGWACLPHTHVIPQEFSEDRNPWHLVGDNFVYDGQVDGSENIAGNGMLRLGDHLLMGKFSGSPSSLTLSGGRVAADSFGEVRRGTFSVDLGRRLAELQSGEEVDDDGRVAFQGRISGPRKVGVFLAADGEKFVGAAAGPDGVRAGSITREDGSKLTFAYGESDVAEAGPATYWGQIQIGERRYWGQIKNGKPSGCGVWEESGRRTAGFFVDGARAADAGSECKRARYRASTALQEAAAAPAADAAAPPAADAAAPAAPSADAAADAAAAPAAAPAYEPEKK